ncbi:MAG: GlsB/YeaQ/YmgE family stress response membrane protein [Egibacteraceae bacterium]
MIGSILLLLVIGLIAGALARFLVPGPDPMSIVATIILGIVGSFVGGLLAALIPGGRGLGPVGIIGSIIGAIIALLIYRQVKARSA